MNEIIERNHKALIYSLTTLIVEHGHTQSNTANIVLD